MHHSRQYSLIDRIIDNADKALRTLSPGSQSASRPSPAEKQPAKELTPEQNKHAASLMRVNHTGEVCAQALYQGQSLTAKLSRVRAEMEHAASEEVDHLAWCEQRLNDLGHHPSRLNPLWYGMSFSLGAGAGLISDKFSLGFVAATEEQVCKHLQGHLEQLPEEDAKSRAVVEVMLDDEQKHGQAALKAGGWQFPAPIKSAMSAVSTVMTYTAYRI